MQHSQASVPPYAYDKPMSVLAIAGSLRRKSYNRLLLRAAIECAPPNIVITIDQEIDSVPLFNEDLEAATNGVPQAVKALRQRVAAADGLLFATPEYNQSIPGVLKNTIDWLSRSSPDELGEVLVRKPAAIMGATAGQWGTRLAQLALRHTLTAAEASVMPTPSLYLRTASEKFDSNGHLTDKQDREMLTTLLLEYSSWIRALRHARAAQ